MAVKVNNTANIRKAKRWNERDDAALCVLLKRKLKDVNVALRESENPYERSRLKEQRQHYKSMLRKVESGVYNGDIIFGELQAASALRSEQALRTAEYSTISGGKKYVNSYQNMDFDYENAFRKKRYYGFALPLILLILSIAFVGIFVMGAFLPSEIIQNADSQGISLDSFFVYKLGDGNRDIKIDNDGNWPSGTFDASITTEKMPVKGVPFVDDRNNTPETVLLHADLKMTSINITPFDIVKAWFRTPMLEKTRIDFLEDSVYFQGDSYYYLCFFAGSKGDSLVIGKDEDGNFDMSVIIRHIGTYGTIMFLIISFILGIISILINIVRLFTYTSRKLHIFSLLSFIFSALCMVAPAFATVEGTELGASFKAYFSSITSFNTFLADDTAVVGVGLLFLVPMAINLIMMILPKLFRNRLKKRITYVPKGNKYRSAYNDPLYADEDTLRKLV